MVGDEVGQEVLFLKNINLQEKIEGQGKPCVVFKHCRIGQEFENEPFVMTMAVLAERKRIICVLS